MPTRKVLGRDPEGRIIDIEIAGGEGVVGSGTGGGTAGDKGPTGDQGPAGTAYVPVYATPAANATAMAFATNDVVKLAPSAIPRVRRHLDQ